MLQRTTVIVAGGKFQDVNYQAVNPSQSVGLGGGHNAEWGAEMTLMFIPKNELPQATEVHLVQTVEDVIADPVAYQALHQQNQGFGQLRIPPGQAHAGVGIDAELYGKPDAHYRKVRDARAGQLNNLNVMGANPAVANQIAEDALSDPQLKANRPLTSIDPRYAQQRLGGAIPVYSPALPAVNGAPKDKVRALATQTTGWAATRAAAGQPWTQPACLRDRPTTGSKAAVSGMKFEVSALAEDPATGHSVYVGSVTWGWKLGQSGKAELLPLAKASENAASVAFKAAAAHFNQLQVTDTLGGGGPTRAVMQIPS